MNTTKTLDDDIEYYQRSCHHRLKTARLLSGAGVVLMLALALTLLYFWGRNINVSEYAFKYRYLALAIMVPLLIACAIEWLGFSRIKKILSVYEQVLADLEHVLRCNDRALVHQAIETAKDRSSKNPLAKRLIAQQGTALSGHIETLRKADLHKQLHAELQVFKQECKAELKYLKAQLPLVKAKEQIRSSLESIQRRRDEISTQWKTAFEQFSWWNKLKYAGTTPDFSGMNQITRDLKKMDAQLTAKHSADLERLDSHFEQLKTTAFTRVMTAKSQAEKFIDQCNSRNTIDSDLLKNALLFSALSVPVSVWADLNSAGNVYDALRGVNGNFSDMSDTEIWWETLFLSEESLTGLASLTKGAYFEQLVAGDTGGALFEHFNHPDTDIVIDSVAYQLKATDSASYVNSVDDEIPVIATSEVALQTDAIDSGFSNEEITQAVDLALGDTVIDIGDTAVDAILSGVGGLGVLATLQGINHAAEMHANGGDAVEALFEGAGVAITGTARGLVGAAEMTYNVLASRPSRFVGRLVLKGLKKLDDKMMQAGQ